MLASVGFDLLVIAKPELWWARRMPRWLLGLPCEMDGVGRLNAGQKLNAVFVAVTSVALAITGLIPWIVWQCPGLVMTGEPAGRAMIAGSRRWRSVMSDRVRLHRFTGRGFELLEIPVVQERPLALYVNGQELVTLLCTPSKLDALVVGFLAFEGLIRGLDDIRGLTILEGEGYADVELSSEFVPPRRRVYTSGCGGGITFSLESRESAARWDDSAVDPASLFPLLRQLYLEAHGYRESRGIHAAALADGEKLLIVTEDVGRHNAIDKVCGEAMLRGVPTEGKILLATGRISSEMLRKGAHMGTPIVVSRTSATTLSIQLAKRLGLTLIGYVRGDSFYVYSHPERLVLLKPAPPPVLAR